MVPSDLFLKMTNKLFMLLYIAHAYSLVINTYCCACLLPNPTNPICYLFFAYLESIINCIAFWTQDPNFHPWCKKSRISSTFMLHIRGPLCIMHGITDAWHLIRWWKRWRGHRRYALLQGWTVWYHGGNHDRWTWGKPKSVASSPKR